MTEPTVQELVDVMLDVMQKVEDRLCVDLEGGIFDNDRSPYPGHWDMIRAQKQLDEIVALLRVAKNWDADLKQLKVKAERKILTKRGNNNE